MEISRIHRIRRTSRKTEFMKRFDMAAGSRTGIAGRSRAVCTMSTMGVAGTIGMAGLVGMLGAVWSANAAAQAAGAEGANFIYQVRPGDTLIGVADRFMINPAGWREL